MSRSLKNFASLTDLLEQTGDGRSYRLLVLRSHYRSPMEITPESIEDAMASLTRLDSFARRFASARRGAVNTPDIDAFIERMDDDMDTPAVVAAVFDLVRAANSAADAGDEPNALRAAASVFVITDALGLSLNAEASEVDAATTGLIEARNAARAAKDWSEADRIRAELVALGWMIEDSAQGTTVHR